MTQSHWLHQVMHDWPRMGADAGEGMPTPIIPLQSVPSPSLLGLHAKHTLHNDLSDDYSFLSAGALFLMLFHLGRAFQHCYLTSYDRSSRPTSVTFDLCHLTACNAQTLYKVCHMYFVEDQGLVLGGQPALSFEACPALC
jgi:hypothetical protein